MFQDVTAEHDCRMDGIETHMSKGRSEDVNLMIIELPD